MPSRKSSITQEIRSIRIALRQLQRSIDRLMPALIAARSGAGAGPPRKLKLAPARRAALKLQGQYMGYMRNLKPRQKAKVKRIRTTRGIRVAIATAKKLGA